MFVFEFVFAFLFVFEFESNAGGQICWHDPSAQILLGASQASYVKSLSFTKVDNGGGGGCEKITFVTQPFFIDDLKV